MVATGWLVAYQVLPAVLAVGGAWYAVRRRDAFYAGLYLGSALGGAVFEWIFDTRWYFNLTPDPRLIWLWHVGPVREPLAMVFFYAFFFGIPLILLLEHSDALFARFGRVRLYGLIVLVAALGVLAFEGFNTSVIGVYAYHQRPAFLLLGMPWSNMWFSPAIFCAAFWGALRSRDLLHRATPPAQRSTQIALGVAVLVTAYFVASSLNGIWYVLAQPWSESPRPF